MSVLTQSGEAPRVSPNDFGDHDDRPVGLVLSRFADQRYGETPSEPLTLAQMNLARSLERRAGRMFASPHLLDLSEALDRPALHLAVAGRYLPLQIDTSFGRYGNAEAQDLIPSGTWKYRLDADLLRLWLEEEADELTDLWAERLAASPAGQTVRAPAPRPLAASAQRGVARRIPAPVRRAAAPQRRKLRVAMLQAAKGDPSALSALLSGQQVRRVLDRLSAARPDSDGAELAPIVLDEVALRALAPDLPALGVDASGDSFDFGDTAEQLIAAVRRSAHRQLNARRAGDAVPRAAEMALKPGSLGSAVQAQARSATVRLARIFSPSAVETADAEARRFREVGLPVLAELARHDTIAASQARGVGVPSEMGAPRLGTQDSLVGGLLADARALGSLSTRATLAELADPLVSGLSLEGSDRGLERFLSPDVETRAARRPFGSTALRGLGHAWRAQQAGPQAQAYLMSGGRGVLVQGEGESASRDLWSAPVAAYPGGMAAHSLSPAPTTGRGAALDVDALLERLAKGGAMPLASASKTGRRAGYDATSSGDFAEVLSSSMVSRSQAMAASRAPQVRLQDVLVSSEYFRALTSGVDHVLRTAKLFGRLAPRALTSGSRATVVAGSAPLAQRPDRVRLSSSLEDVARVVARLSASPGPEMHQGRASEAAAAVANLIRDSYALFEAAGAGVSSRGYQGWGSDSVFVAGASSDSAQGLWRSSVTAGAQDSDSTAHEAGAIEALIARAVGAARALEVADIRQLVDRGGPQRQSETRRHFDLFSPEKTLAMIAPQLESGGLLDAESRSELAAAVRELAKGQVSDRAVRRVRTPFGTLSVKVVDGRLLVDAEEISANAPVVGFASTLPAQSSSVNAPTQQLHRLALLNEPKVLRAGQIGAEAGRRHSPGTLAAQVEAQASRGARTASGTAVSRGVEVALGKVSRAERMAGVELDPLASRPSSPDAEAVSARLQLGRGMPAEVTTLLRGGVAGDLVAVVAKSRRSAQVTEAMARSGLALPVRALLDGLSAGDAGALATLAAAGITPRALAAGESSVLSKLRLAGLDGHAIARLRSVAGTAVPVAHWLGTEHVNVASIPEAIARLTERRQRFAARSRSVQDLADLSAADSAHFGSTRQALQLSALGGLLAQAEESRSVGSLGRVGMNRAEDGYFDRADMAYLLPFMQRRATTGWDRVMRSDEVGASPETQGSEVMPVSDVARRALIEAFGPSLASLDPATVLDLGLSAGPGADLGRVARKLGLSDHVISVLEHGTEEGLSDDGVIGFDPSPRGFSAVSSMAWQSPDRTFVAGRTRKGADSWAASRWRALKSSAERAGRAPLALGADPIGAAAQRSTPSALRGSIFQKLAQVDGALASFSLRGPRIGRRASGTGTSSAFGSAFGAPGVVVGGSRRGPASLWGGPTLETTADAPSAARMQAAENVVASGAQRESQVGVTGIWMPSGVEKLTGATADIMTRPGHRLDGTLVAPKMFSATRKGGGWAEVKSPESSEVPAMSRLGLRSSDLKRIAHSMALGLQTFASPRGSREGYAYSGGTGPVVSMAVGKRLFGSGRWMRSTSSQDGAAALMDFLGVDSEGTLPPRHEQVMPLHQGTFVQMPSGKSQQGLFEKPKQAQAGASAPKPKRRSSAPAVVPTKQSPGYGGSDFGTNRDLFNPFMAPGQGAGVTALASKGGSSGRVESAQTENRGEHAHQSGTPPLEAIEDTAIEIFEILQRRWALELERRGVE